VVTAPLRIRTFNDFVIQDILGHLIPTCTALDTLRNDKEFNLSRGRSADDNFPILVLSPVAEYPAPEVLKDWSTNMLLEKN
jgi:hypothetical protein